MRRTVRQAPERPDASPWATRVTRFIVGILVAVAAVAAWRAATRWLADGATLADRSGPERSEPPVLPDGTAEVAGHAEAVAPLSSVVQDARDSPSAPALDVPVRPARSGARWTAEDDAYLAAHMDEAPDAVAHHLGRTPSAVTLRRATLRRDGR